MKDLGFRFKLAKDTLKQLSAEFNVDMPKLMLRNMRKLHGFYSVGVITLNTDILHENFAETLRTVRHEFYHYLEDALNLPQCKSEFKARKFERNILPLGTLPKNQTRLLEVKK